MKARNVDNIRVKNLEVPETLSSHSEPFRPSSQFSAGNLFPALNCHECWRAPEVAVESITFRLHKPLQFESFLWHVVKSTPVRKAPEEDLTENSSNTRQQ